MMKYVVYSLSDEVVSVVDTEAEAIVERDKAMGRIVFVRDDTDPLIRAFLVRRPTTGGR